MTTTTPTKRGRGRPPKRSLEDDTTNNASAPPAKKRGGRPKGSTNHTTLAHPEPELGPITSPRSRKAASHANDAIAETLSPQRSRGRSKKTTTAPASPTKPRSNAATAATGAKRGRGRPPKSESTTATTKPAGRVAKTTASPTKRRGRPPKTQTKTDSASPSKTKTKTKTKTTRVAETPAATKKPTTAQAKSNNTVTIDKKKLKAIEDRLAELEFRVGRIEDETYNTDVMADVLEELNGGDILDDDDEEAETEIEVDVLPSANIITVSDADVDAAEDDVQVLAMQQENGDGDAVIYGEDDEDIEDIRASLGPVDYDATIGGRATGVGVGAGGEASLQNAQLDGANGGEDDGILGPINHVAESVFAKVIHRFGGVSPSR